ncbi:MAG: hypothetical protein C9356_13115 [Oleiphilus sp.]|nr:MAG: hypothetical protein C9356_13115 [Oleiphilus sp.]
MTFFHAFGNQIQKKLTLILLSTTLLAGICHADENQALEDVYHVIVHSYYSVNGFYNFSANQADKTQNEVIQVSINTIDGLMRSLEENVGDSAFSEQLDNAQEQWSNYRKSLQQNIKEVVRTGYPDLRLAGDMANNNIAFNESITTLYDTISSSVKPSELTQTARDATTILALMMTKYSARSTSTVSQVYSGGDAEITIDALAAQFDQKINKLTNMPNENADAARLLDSAKTQWEFIKDSYINYNENRVNFIVNLYSKKIISNIEESIKS